MTRPIAFGIVAALLAVLPGCNQGRYQFVIKPSSSGGHIIYACDTHTGTYFNARHVPTPRSAAQ